MIEIGKIQKLKVSEKVKDGLMLCNANNKTESVLLPSEFISRELELGEEVEVFVYVDTNESDLIATLQHPVAEVGEFAFIRVKEIHEFGSFLEWGIEKDLLVPGNEQKEKFGSHGKKLVRVCIEEGTNRIFGTTKFGKYIESQYVNLGEGDRVPIIPVEKTTLGFRCIVDKSYIGMIYHNEIFQKIEIGEQYLSVVKLIREDGLLDMAMQTQGVNNLFESTEKILLFLEDQGGESHLHDKSTPDEIKRLLGMSKKTFKSAIGMLYKDKKITISPEGIRLT